MDRERGREREKVGGACMVGEGGRRRKRSDSLNFDCERKLYLLFDYKTSSEGAHPNPLSSIVFLMFYATS